MTKGQLDVLEVLLDYGPLPDHALVPIAQHVQALPQSSSSIRSRRAELSRLGLVEPVGTVTIKRTGRRAVSHQPTVRARNLFAEDVYAV